MARPRPFRLDELDKRIIELLQHDGRMAYSVIAREVELSEAAVRQRARVLIDSGVMQIVAVTDPLQLGFGREAMVAVRTSGNPAVVAERLGEIEEVDFVVLTAGSFDILLEIVAETDDHLLELVSSIRETPGVASTETLVYLKTRKQDYSWGVR